MVLITAGMLLHSTHTCLANEDCLADNRNRSCRLGCRIMHSSSCHHVCVEEQHRIFIAESPKVHHGMHNITPDCCMS